MVLMNGIVIDINRNALDNNAFRVIMGLRLGLDICTPHTCLCGYRVDSKVRHGLKCRKSAGRHARHAELNTIIKRALVSADLSREDGKRVNGMTLIPWSRDSTLIWDANRAGTFALSNLKFSAKRADGAAEDKVHIKTTKYASLKNNNYLFVPFSVETMGSWGTEAVSFFNVLSIIALHFCLACILRNVVCCHHIKVYPVTVYWQNFIYNLAD